MRERKYLLQFIDPIVLFVYFALMAIGWISIYAAVYDPEHMSILDSTQSYGKQFIWIITSVVIMILISAIDFRLFEKVAIPVYIGMLLLLIFVALFGKTVNGQKGWFEVGSFSLQPSEFAKFATNLAVAYILSSFMGTRRKANEVLLLFVVILIPALIILLQPDTGSALVYATFIFVFYREGVIPGYFLVIGAMAILLAVLALLIQAIYIVIALTIIGAIYLLFTALVKKSFIKFFFICLTVYISAIGLIYSVSYLVTNVLQDHQRNRINVLLGLEKDVKGLGYNVNQSLIAIGSGGLSGKGFLQGTQTKFNFVPEQSTDFIFCTIGEEFGFIGSSILICLFLLLIYRIVYLAEKQTSVFARIYGYGVASIFFFHVMVNIGMTIGLLPVIGIPLPFISYGGSSLWAFTILLAIFLNLDSSRKLTLGSR